MLHFFSRNKHSQKNCDTIKRGNPYGFINKTSRILDEERDSKVLSKKKREKIFEVRDNLNVEYFIKERSNLEIDKFGIVECITQCVREILTLFNKSRSLVLLDGYFKDLDLSDKTREFRQIIDGDAKCYSIAIASIFAKVHRDNQMKELDKLYPGYEFDKNVGYGTSKHLQSLKEFGICSIHRRSFKPIKKFITLLGT